MGDYAIAGLLQAKDNFRTFDWSAGEFGPGKSVGASKKPWDVTGQNDEADVRATSAPESLAMPPQELHT